MIATLAAVSLLFASQAAADAAPSCTPETATAATVVEIAGDPERFLDRCVTVTGAVAGISMYSGREGMYLAFRYGADGNHSEEARLHRIGIDRQDIRNLRMAYPQQTTVTGRVDSCERRYQRIADAGGIPFLAGYCHYYSGPTIVVDSYAITEKRHERMTGEAARARYGNIDFMPEDWPARAATEAVVADFLAAMRSGDRSRVAALHEFDDEDNEYQRRTLYALLQDRDSPLARLRQAEPPQVALFVSMAEDGTLLGRERTAPGRPGMLLPHRRLHRPVADRLERRHQCSGSPFRLHASPGRRKPAGLAGHTSRRRLAGRAGGKHRALRPKLSAPRAPVLLPLHPRSRALSDRAASSLGGSCG